MIVERITTRAFDITITRYIDATIFKFHSINKSFFTKGFYFRYSYDEYSIHTYSIKEDLRFDDYETIFKFPIADFKEDIVQIESENKFLKRLKSFQQFRDKYPPKKDVRPEWF